MPWIKQSISLGIPTAAAATWRTGNRGKGAGRMAEAVTQAELGTDYKYGFHDDIQPVFKSRKGLDREVVA